MQTATVETPRQRSPRYWPMFVLPFIVLALGISARFLLLPRLDRWASGPPPLDVLEQAEIPPEDRFPGQPDEIVGVLNVLPSRHWGAMNCAAISSSGKWLATGSEEHTVCLWDAATLRVVAVLTDFNDRPHSLTFTPDSTSLLVTCGAAVSIWNITTNPPQRTALLPATAAIQSTSVSADGKRILLANADAVVQLWDLTEAQPTQRFTTPLGKPDDENRLVIRSVALSTDGKTMATSTGPQGDMLALYDVSGNGPVEKQKLKPAVPSFTLVFAPDLKTLTLIDEEGRVKVRDTDKEKSRADLEDSGPWLVYSADSKTLATCTVGGTLRLWDLERDAARVRSSFTLKHGAPLEWTAFSADLKAAITAGSGAVRLWDISGTVPVTRGTLQSRQRSALALAFSPDGKTLAAAGWFPKAATSSEVGEEGGVQFWDLTGKQPKERVRVGGHKKDVNWIAFAPNGKTLASAGDDATTRLWDLTGQVKERAVLQGAAGPVAFSPSSKQLVTATGGLVQLWSSGGDEIGRWAKYPDPKAPANKITGLAFSPDGGTLATGTRHRTVDLWALGGALPGERLTLEGVQLGYLIAFMPDGKGLLTAGLDWNIRLFDLSGPTPKVKYGPEAIANPTSPADPVIAFSPNGRLAAQVFEGNAILVWNPTTGKRHFQWRYPGEVKALAFAPDSRHVATANGNGTVYIMRLGRPGGAPRPRDTAPEQP